MIDRRGISFNIPSVLWLLVTPALYSDCRMSYGISPFLCVLCTICVNQFLSLLSPGHYHSSRM